MHPFPHSLTRTAPGSQLRMGALLRDALAHQGVSFRVAKPYTTLPDEHLVATADQAGPRVWIHAVDCNGHSHYDIPRAGLMAVAAVITDETGTRFVFDGFSWKEARPVAQAQACARAVAVFLGLEPREPESTWSQDDAQDTAVDALRFRHGDSTRCSTCHASIIWHLDSPNASSDYGLWVDAAGCDLCPATDENAVNQFHTPQAS